MRAKASKLAIVDKLLPLLEAFGASAARQRQLRKEMKASACTHPAREVVMPSLLGETRTVPCFDSQHGRTPWCDACRQHDQFFTKLMAERAANKKRQLRLVTLAIVYAEQEPEVSPEPKELLELIHKLTEEETNGAETTLVRDGDIETAHH